MSQPDSRPDSAPRTTNDQTPGRKPVEVAMPYRACRPTRRRPLRPIAVSIDPPYYDNVGYAAPFHFFYVWLRRSLAAMYRDLFSTIVTPKSTELVADPFRSDESDGDKSKSEQLFEEGLERASANLSKATDPSYPLTVLYAFKQSEHDKRGVASTGRKAMLAGLLHSGFAVTATWPTRTELDIRMHNQASNSLVSSIVLACRPRSDTQASPTAELSSQRCTPTCRRHSVSSSRATSHRWTSPRLQSDPGWQCYPAPRRSSSLVTSWPGILRRAGSPGSVQPELGP